MYDFLIVGGGVFGLSTAISLAQKKYKIGLINPDTIPNHLAASTDISKVVRMEYGSDTEYFKMAEMCIERWHEWNDLFKEKIYHEVGCLMLSKFPFEHPKSKFEKASYDQLLANGYACERMDAFTLKKRFPNFKEGTYQDANFNPKAGFVESGLAIAKMAEYARSLGVDIQEGQTAEKLILQKNRLIAVQTREGQTIKCGQTIIAAGAHTPYLLPELQPYMKATGHPVFWLKPANPSNYTADKLPVFFADIANSGWYGFPVSAKKGVVKIAKHTEGLKLHPDKDDRQIKDAEVADMRQFLATTFPDLLDAPLVYTRRCLYTDTLDGHFWIDHHPEIKGVAVSSGGSGHGMKMGPILGEMTAAMALEEDHQFSSRYRWRHLTAETVQTEEARFLENR